jgi:FKBP-type peptidyl-prolyl cis-trans isomerase
MRRACALGVLGAGLVLWACSAEQRSGDVVLDTEEQKTAYALGLRLAEGLRSYGLSPEETDLLLAGFQDGIGRGEPRLVLDEWRQRVDAMARDRLQAAQLEAGRQALERAAGEPGAVRTESGLVIVEEKAGEGESPMPDQTVRVHYHGTLPDGSVFDSSVERGRPATFPLQRVIPCWQELLQKMKVGGKSRVTCPAATAYGDRGFPPRIPPGATLQFEIELVEIVKR